MGIAEFRAWDTEEKVYRYLNILGEWDCEDCLFVRGNSAYTRIILEQYTGIRDKNSAKLYDGDIIKNTKYGGTAVIVWGIPGETYCGWGIQWIHNKPSGLPTYALLYYKNLENCEKIGNRHENPELLGGM